MPGINTFPPLVPTSAPSLDGPYGLKIGTVTTLPPGSSATVTITGSYGSQTISFGIPSGPALGAQSAPANQFCTGADGTGALVYAQPSFANLSGSASAAQVPPLSSLNGSVTPSQVPISGSGSLGAVKPDTTATVSAAGLLSDAVGFRNKIMNGSMRVGQRGATIAAPANGAYTLDRWRCWWGGGAPASIAKGTGPTGYRNAMVITGGSGNTSTTVMNYIESVDCYDLVGQPVALSATLQGSSAQRVAWSLSYASGAGGADDFSAITLIASGTWSVTTSAQRFSAPLSALPTNVRNGMVLAISPNNNGAFTSGTLTIAGVQLELGTQATPFENLPLQVEFAECSRFYTRRSIPTSTGASTGFVPVNMSFTSHMRATPTVSILTAPTYVNSTNFAFNSASSDDVTFTYQVTSGGGYINGGTIEASADL